MPDQSPSHATLREQIAQQIEREWDEVCDGNRNIEVCESCRAYDRAIEIARTCRDA